MRELIVKRSEDGIAIDKYLRKVFDKMPNATLYKLLRKKYFEINGKKANGKEILRDSDKINVFLSDDTFYKFYSDKALDDLKKGNKVLTKEIRDRIVYEDDNIIIYNKEVGLLSQGDRADSVSVNSILNEYLHTDKEKQVYIPSVVNRLDRNTSGIIIFAKNYIAARAMSSMIRDDDIEKRYAALVNGLMDKSSDTLINILKKDEDKNIVTIKEYGGIIPKGYSLVELEYKVIKKYESESLLDVHLITGKSHQIRAQLSFIGHPIVCDKKYMDISLYRENVKRHNYRTQKLICYKIKFGKFSEDKLKYLDNKTFQIDIKDVYI